MKRFDLNNKCNKATTVDCLECEHYYTSACDGNAGGCKSYTPTRKITMVDDIETIKRRMNWLCGFTLLGWFVLGLLIIL